MTEMSQREPVCEGGVTTRWCPRCGTCTCQIDQGDVEWIESADCPIHGPRSTHSEEEPALTEPQGDETPLMKSTGKSEQHCRWCGRMSYIGDEIKWQHHGDCPSFVIASRDQEIARLIEEVDKWMGSSAGYGSDLRAAEFRIAKLTSTHDERERQVFKAGFIAALAPRSRKQFPGWEYNGTVFERRVDAEYAAYRASLTGAPKEQS